MFGNNRINLTLVLVLPIVFYLSITSKYIYHTDRKVVVLYKYEPIPYKYKKYTKYDYYLKLKIIKSNITFDYYSSGLLHQKIKVGDVFIISLSDGKINSTPFKTFMEIILILVMAASFTFWVPTTYLYVKDNLKS